MVTWTADGGVSGPVRTASSPGGPGYVAVTNAAVYLASPGTVDVNHVTRLQYGPLENYQISGQRILTVDGQFTFSVADANANTNRKFSATMFVAPDSAFTAGSKPTPTQIRDAATLIYRATDSLAGSGALTFHIDGPHAEYLQRGSKYWLLVVPTSIANMSFTPNRTHDQTVGTLDTIGRAISFWTNRTPLAPVITSPANGVIVAPNSVVTLSFVNNDPDKIVSLPGDTDTYMFDDRSGVQVQYAARPTADNPSPVWRDLPVVNKNDTGLGKGYYISRMYASDTDELNAGARVLWTNRAIFMRCGSNTLTPGYASLPAGEWQIRLRVFDYGHDEPSFWGPLGIINYGDPRLNPDTFPAFNTSPWSSAITVSITAQVPPPIAASPAKDVAIPLNTVVTLSWLYRNTASPPFAQASRTLQIKRSDAVNWTTLVSGNATDTTYVVPSSYVFVSGFSYQWRVQVTDTNGVTSNYSEAAEFWIVPQPITGPTRPVPTSTLDGASLGIGNYKVVVYRRGGKRRVGQIRNITSLDWERVRDDISTAKVTVSGWDIDNGNLLAKLQTWAYEIAIYRDNGFTTDRVWEGPITLLTYERDSVTIQAKDVMAYAYRRIIKLDLNDAGTGDTVTSRAARVLQNTLASDDPNVLAYLTPMVRGDDAMQYRSLPAWSRTAYEEVDDMAANAGLDYTVAGRAILLWGTKHRIGTLPEFRDDDLGATPIVSEYGMAMADVYSVSNGNGIHGEATRLDADGKNSTYGLVEMLSSSWASDSADDTGTYTQAGIATITESFKGFAERSISDRYPPPVVVRVPDNTTLNPSANVGIQQLVPGVVIPLRSTGTLRSVVADQKLDSIKVTRTSAGESITLTMSPFNSDDSVTADEGDV